MKIAKAWTRSLDLKFITPAKTSRDVLHQKTSHFITLENEDGNIGIGECSPIYGLSIENEAEVTAKISELIYLLNHNTHPKDIDLKKFPALNFALESAILDLTNGGTRILYNTTFARGTSSILINGLIWMNTIDHMLAQVKSKVEKGFECIKIKIGSLDFQEEVTLLKKIRSEFGYGFELRLDANGAFDPKDAINKLETLSRFNIHSIEQPIRGGQTDVMAEICEKSPIPIALDEELIGVDVNEANVLLKAIKPAYIILKPTLLGGLHIGDQWIEAARALHIDWWATSALESNLGLNAIAQWVSTKKFQLHQGLGTGQLYENNLTSPLSLDGQILSIDPEGKWDLKLIV